MKNLKSSTLVSVLVLCMVTGYILYAKAAYSFGNWVYNLNTPIELVTPVAETNTPSECTENTIQIALLLDTSSSMDGLIEQAKSQLWKIVSQLGSAEHDMGETDLQIALYEYGNSGLSMVDGYIRQVSSFTTDMDLISEKLFALSTNGGEEYCGQVIYKSMNQLDWSNYENGLRMIYIAGNEGFNQGTYPYAKACKTAKDRDIIINTIFCGNINEGINTKWKDGADLTEGNFMNINHNDKTVYIETPYDKEISTLSSELNTTYIPYGENGMEYQMNQSVQDSNAGFYSQSNTADRASFKASKKYKNDKWDLVDAYEKDKSVIKKEKQLPKQFEGKATADIEKEVKEMKEKRSSIQNKIKDLDKKRKDFIKAEKAKTTNSKDDNLENSILKSVKEKAVKKGYKFKE